MRDPVKLFGFSRIGSHAHSTTAQPYSRYAHGDEVVCSANERSLPALSPIWQETDKQTNPRRRGLYIRIDPLARSLVALAPYFSLTRRVRWATFSFGFIQLRHDHARKVLRSRAQCIHTYYIYIVHVPPTRRPDSHSSFGTNDVETIPSVGASSPACDGPRPTAGRTPLGPASSAGWLPYLPSSRQNHLPRVLLYGTPPVASRAGGCGLCFASQASQCAGQTVNSSLV